jgi:LAO/AO transport system kinase
MWGLSKRYALSKAITLMESKNPQRKQQGDYLLTYLLSQRPHDEEPRIRPLEEPTTTNGIQDDGTEQATTRRSTIPKTLRVGFAGPPGAGKSTLLEAFGMYLLEDDPTLHLAVVCIDPSSGISGGSILGDKTRMTELSRQERAYVRPSSNSGVLGGLSAYTDDVVTTLAVAGYPLVLVETVGLGQSEMEVIESVDVLVLLLPPGGGDELQGVKKGIVEMAHILAVTKADGKLLETAISTQSDYKGAIRVLQQSNSSNVNTNEQQLPPWRPRVLLTSAVTKEGLDELWKSIQDYRSHLIQSGQWEIKRKQQARYWMWKQFTGLMQTRLKQDRELGQQADHLESELLQGHFTPRVAAQELLDGVFGRMEGRTTRYK